MHLNSCIGGTKLENPSRTGEINLFHEKQLDPARWGEGSRVPIFLKKYIASCDYTVSGMWSGPHAINQGGPLSSIWNKVRDQTNFDVTVYYMSIFI